MSMVALETPSIHARLDTLGGRIRAVLMARHMTVTDAARRAKVSRTSFSNWMNGGVKEPDMKGLGEFCAATEISLDWLAARRGPDPEILKPTSASGKITDGIAETRPIPEISGSMAAHAKQLDTTAHTHWTIPANVVQLGLNSEPGNLVIQRVVSSDAKFERGDYVLIDTSRTVIDDVGAYLIATGAMAYRIFTDGTQQALPDGAKVLGRVMAFLRPA